MLDLISLFQNLANGLLIGTVYAMIGIGLTLIFSVMSTINFAHGDFVVLGMYAAVFLSTLLGWDPYLSLVLIAPAGFLLGVLVQKVILERTVDASQETSMLVTLGISLIVGNLLLLTFGTEPKSIYTTYASSTVKFWSVHVSVVLLLAGLATLVVITALYLLLHRTEVGRSIRATAENALGAELVGIDTKRIQAIVMGLGTLLAVTAGVTLIPLLYATPTSTGPLFTLKAFVVIVLGGLGNVTAAAVGGILLGLVEVLGASYLSSDYREAYGLVAFLLVLLLKPEGLFGKTVKRV
ncbi:branched-chain amino acid ABC transporter permease [Castellaniella sp.]|jgi:branched-chain amino acid transport system permease protein|uniref:branched-chain amino acid ABC transporter permease n=1 Tax=Castellaniella sp. TaxID=1955812 RepID=UPI003A93CEEA